MHEAILVAEAEVDVPPEAAQDWFLSLTDHPERYTFDTHQGFEFERGRFGEVGAQFTTRETFLCLNLDLLFELRDVRENAFSFRLVRPISMGIWGRFEIEPRDGTRTLLALRIGSETRVGRLLLRFFPVTAAVRRQIAAEVNHIKGSMERTYDSGYRSHGEPVPPT